MNRREVSFSKILLATLPILVSMGRLSEALPLIFFIVLSFWGTALLFRLAAPLFPESIKEFSMVLTVASLTQYGFDHFTISPLAGVSILLLLAWGKTRGNRSYGLQGFSEWTQVMAGRGFFFLWAASLLASFQEFLGHQCGLGMFTHPAGAILLLAVMGFAWTQTVKVPLRRA